MTAVSVRWTLIDTMTIAGRTFLHWRQRPGSFVVNLLFPIMMVVMFGYLLGGAMTVPGGGNYLEFLMPGMFAITMAFGLEATMTAVADDAAKGITDRFRSLPMNASAILTGRAVADMANSAVGLLAMIAFGLMAGWRWHGGAGAALLAVGLLLLLRFAMLWIGVYLGLLVKGPDSVMAVQILVWPFIFFSSTFAAPATMPAWLGAIAQWNPMSATIDACRTLFGNPGVGESWVAQHAVLMAVVWPVLLLGIFVPLAVRRYRRLSR